MMKSLATAMLVAIMVTSAFGRDLELLGKILSSPFLVQQGIAICSTGDVPFTSEETATLLSAGSHANYMKLKISESLKREEVEYVLRNAANRARAYMSEVIRLLKENPPDLEQVKRVNWCKQNLIQLANKTLTIYQDNKDRFEAIIEQAKQNEAESHHSK